MNKLSDKEAAFIRRAQREAANSETDTETADGVPGTIVGWDDAAVLGAESAFPETVIGWDNPAAEKADTTGGDKWAYIAAMIESERAAAYASRARHRRIALSVAGVVVFIALAALLQAFMV